VLASLRTDATGQWQVELHVARDLDEPSLALYWSPEDAGESLPSKAVFLGLLWGPGIRRYPLPDGNKGWLLLASLVRGGELVAKAPMRSSAADRPPNIDRP
jgi:hypothetical protein